jgi:hypothetical protein
MHGGALPAMPLLAALPGAGPLPAYAWLLTAIPVGAGGVIGWHARPPAGTRGWREELITAGTSSVVCGLGIGVLAGLSGGDAGGRLAQVGPNGLIVGALLALQLAAAALAFAGARIGWEHYRGPKKPAVVPEAAETPEPAETQETTDEAKPARLRRFGIPRQKTKADAAESANTPIVVVKASEVEDLPVEDLPVEGPEDLEAHAGDLEDLENTQELPVFPLAVLTEDDLRDLGPIRQRRRRRRRSGSPPPRCACP